jgi:septal ring factor EnvC (AmiA/AmiB activator)
MASLHNLARECQGENIMTTEESRGLSMSEMNSLANQISEVKEDMREIRASMSKIADAVTRLAVLESQNKANGQRMENLEARQTTVEKESAETRLSLIRATAQLSGAMTTIKILWAVIGSTALTIVVKLFLG